MFAQYFAKITFAKLNANKSNFAKISNINLGKIARANLYKVVSKFWEIEDKQAYIT